MLYQTNTSTSDLGASGFFSCGIGNIGDRSIIEFHMLDS